MPIRSGGPAPYGPPHTVVTLIRAYRNRGLQTPFNAEVLERAGVSASLVPRILQAVRLLDLIDENGNPTPELEGLRRAGEAEYPQRLETIVRNAYAEVFQYVDPARDDETKVKDAFRAYEPLGQLSRMVTLFLGLCAEANIITEVKRKPTRNATTRSARPIRRSVVVPAREVVKYKRTHGRSEGVQHGPLPPAIEGLLAALPINGEGWTQAQRKKFLDTFTSVLDFSIPTRDEPAAVESDEEE